MLEEASPAAQDGNGNGNGNGGDDSVLAGMPPPYSAEELDPERPNQRYVVGCLNDMEEAKRRWRISLEWRREEGIDGILDEPQQYFDLIKEVRRRRGL